MLSKKFPLLVYYPHTLWHLPGVRRCMTAIGNLRGSNDYARDEEKEDGKMVRVKMGGCKGEDGWV